MSFLDPKPPTLAQFTPAFVQAFNVPAPVANADTNRTNIQTQIDAAAAAGGGCVQLQRGEYLVNNTITLPNNKYVWLRGAGLGQVGNTFGTRIRRSFGDVPLIQALGTLTSRPRFTISDMEINGGGGTTILNLSRVSGSSLRNLRVTSSAGSLLVAEEWWNCTIANVNFMVGGTGRAIPAVWFKAPAALPSDPGNTIQITGCLWEGNSGTDLKLSGSTDGVLALLASNIKMERDIGDYPLIDLDMAGACQFSDGFFHLGPGATAPHVEQKGSATVPSRPNGFSNCEFSANKLTGGGTAGEGAVLPYLIDCTVGSLLLSNISMNGSPTTAFVHIGSGVGANDVRLSNVAVTDRSILMHDERPGTLYGYGSIPLTVAVSDVAVTKSVNRPVWILPDAATNAVYYHNIPIPPDASYGRPARVRLVWYSDAAAGAVRVSAGLKALDVNGADITAGQTDAFATLTVAGTANTTKASVMSTTVVLQPGSRYLAVFVSRIGADAADTCAGGFRLLGAELLYEKAM